MCTTVRRTRLLVSNQGFGVLDQGVISHQAANMQECLFKAPKGEFLASSGEQEKF